MPADVLSSREREAVLRLRSILAETGYDTREVGTRLGAPDPELSEAEMRSLWQWRARHSDPLSVLLRLFFLGDPVDARALRRFGDDNLKDWQRQRWIFPDGARWKAAIELSLHGALVIACDRQDRQDRPHRHFVAGPTRATGVLADALLPNRGDSALDLGTGTGILALRFSEKLQHRVATDINPRALRFAAWNALLNGQDGIELLPSDGYNAVGTRRFHQIAGNLPFVITPRQRYSFRETGVPGDAFLSRTIRETTPHLAEGGVAQFLGQWIHRDGEGENERLASMLSGTGLDALFLRTRIEAADAHAARWLAGPESLDAGERLRRMRGWVSALHALGVQAVSTGLIVLRRRKAKQHFLVVDEAAERELTGKRLERRLDALDRALTRSRG